jgi:hypothetical protein
VKPIEVVPVGQSVLHEPSRQTWPVAQALPQLPQLAALFLVSTQAPLQLAKPRLQLMPHTPALHTAVPLAGASQTVLQVPQWSMSVMASTQLEPQAVKLGSHSKPQLETAQVALACSGAGQPIVQLPQ